MQLVNKYWKITAYLVMAVLFASCDDLASSGDAPTGLRATVGDGQVVLNWNVSESASGYKVYKDGLLEHSISGKHTTTYTATELRNGQSYVFAVSAILLAGESALSTPVIIAPQVIGVVVQKSVCSFTDSDGNGFIEICSLDDLRSIRNNLRGKYELVKDLDFQNAAHYKANSPYKTRWLPTGGNPTTATNRGWLPIGDSISAPFTGEFNGRGNTIKNLYIRGGSFNEYLGLFGIVLSGGTVSNLIIENAHVYGGLGSDYVAAAVGYNGGTVTAVSADAVVSGGEGSDLVGVLIGFNNSNGRVTASYAQGSAAGGNSVDNVGGLIGSNSGTAAVSYAKSTAAGGDGDDVIGGLIGTNRGTVAAAYATGTVTGNNGNDFAGGLAGTNLGTITDTYATGNIDGSEGTVDLVGKLVGNNSGSSGSSGTVTASYGFGTIAGRERTQNTVDRSADAQNSNVVPNARYIMRSTSSTAEANEWALTVWKFARFTDRKPPVLLWSTGYTDSTHQSVCDKALLPPGAICGGVIPKQQ